MRWPSKTTQNLEVRFGSISRTLCAAETMSALPPKADICSATKDVRFTPKADMCGAQRHVRFVPIADIDVYSITSSARASTDGGIVRPCAFAVLRLITSSYLVGACTGISAGVSPFRIRST